MSFTLVADGRDVSAYQDALVNWMRQTRKTMPQALRIEGLQLGRLLIAFTPPQGGLGQGKAAVKRDIQRAVKPIKPDFDSERLNKAIRRMVRKKDYSGLQAVFDRMKRGVIVEPFSSDLHQRVRNRRGRVAKDAKTVTPDVDEVRDYIRTTQEHVGQARGGWAAGVVALGGNVANWVGRHRRAGEFIDRADSLVSAYIKFTNKSEWTKQGDEDRIVANAIRSRRKVLLKKLADAQERAMRKAKVKR